jgi:acetamidase/formamidase
VLRIKPGDRVITRRSMPAARTERQAGDAGANPQTGPFFIEGAEPGDMIRHVHEDGAQSRDRVFGRRACAYTVTPFRS